MARLKEVYREKILPELMKKNGYGNVMEVPRVTKIVVNMCLGNHGDKDDLKNAAEELSLITGQKAVFTKARLSISNFRLREGMPIGTMVTLRGERMYEFLERLIHAALPRIRDFRGVSAKAFDGRGNYTLGIAEQTIFPEINPDRVKRTQGMDVCIVTTAKTNDEGRELLRQFGMPFAN